MRREVPSRVGRARAGSSSSFVSRNLRHDGKIIAAADDRFGCPSATDSVITNSTDPQNTGGVLCVDQGL